MSYNITCWKVKKLENLKVPVKEFYKHERIDWHPSKPQIIEFEENTVELECGCGQEIKGVLKDGVLDIKVINMQGEGSGTFVEWILEPALKNSTGILEVSCIWEGGDIINKLIVNNGNVKWEDIDI